MDALIVGAGVIGLAIARSLSRRGVRRIAVLDRGRVGGEASWAAAGMLAPNAECDRVDDFHRFCTESLGLYPEFAASLLAETGIDIELDRTGTLYLAFTDEDVREIRERYTWQAAAGLSIEQLSAEETLRVEPSVSRKVQESLFFPNDWQVENRKLVEALREYCVRNGVSLIQHVEVLGVAAEGGRVVGVKTSAGLFSADRIVLTGGAWSTSLEGANFPFAVRPIRGQMLCYRSDRSPFHHVIYSPRGYLVPRKDGRILAGSTVEDVGFDKNVSEAGIETIKGMVGEIAPALARAEPIDQWAGLRPFVPPDGLPVTGGFPGLENLFVATGHYRNGILLTPITARIVAEKILGLSDSTYLKIFGLERFSRAICGTV